MKNQARILTVSELSAQIKDLLEQRFPLVWVSGEVSNFSAPVSGHFYFTLKDESAQIRAVMFRGQNRFLKFALEDGMQLTGMGRISVYELRGSYQLILEYVEPSGTGALQKAFEQLKARLAQEGLFDESHKKEIPFLPQRIALITSPTGAVVHDFLRVALNRFPNLQITIIPSQVQGPAAVGDLCSAIDSVNKHLFSDVIVIARGGGSLEDLQAFNSEAVARAIFSSAIPVVSAVGHETDFTIADFVADRRAPTPSAAAEGIVPQKSDLLHRNRELQRQAESLLRRHIKNAASRLEGYCRRLIHPKRTLDRMRLKTDDFSIRLIRAFRRKVGQETQHLFWLYKQLRSEGPEKRIGDIKFKLELNKNNLLNMLNIYLNKNRSYLDREQSRLAALNPAAVLERGFSITRSEHTQKIVRDPRQVSEGQLLRITVAKGDLRARVER